MERKGSGMGKIMDAYKVLPYLSTDMLPVFFSDRAQFTVTFPNMINVWENGNKEKTTTLKLPQSTTSKLPQNTMLCGVQQQILSLLRNDAYLSMGDLAARIGSITKDGIKYHLGKLQEAGLILHHGPSRGGSWEVI